MTGIHVANVHFPDQSSKLLHLYEVPVRGDRLIASEESGVWIIESVGTDQDAERRYEVTVRAVEISHGSPEIRRAPRERERRPFRLRRLIASWDTSP